MLFKNALLLLAAASTALVFAYEENTLSPEFDSFPECAKKCLKETPSKKCGTHITPACYCNDGDYILTVKSRGKCTTETERKDAFKQHCAMCLH